MPLVAEYAFNEGTGTTGADTSGGSHTATVTAWATGHTGTGAAGDSTHPAATYAGTLITGTTFTMMGWFKCPALSGLPDLMALGNAANMAGSYVDLYRATATTVEVEVKPTGGSFVDSASFTIPNPQTAFVHLAVTVSGTTATVYANGASIGTRTFTGSLGTLAYLTAGGNAAFGTYNTATVDDLRVFNTALSSADITTYMNTPAGSTVYPASVTIAATSSATVAATSVLRATSSAAAVTSVTIDASRVPRVYPANMTAAAVTGVTVNATRVPRTYTASAAAAATSGSTIAATLRANASVTIPAVSAASFAATVTSGTQTYPASIRIDATTTASSSVSLIAGATVTVGVTSDAATAATARLGASCAIAATSATYVAATVHGATDGQPVANPQLVIDDTPRILDVTAANNELHLTDARSVLTIGPTNRNLEIA